MVTIPPVSWINASHINGVSVLGTFITENVTGEEICKQFLSSKELIDQVCFQLVEICKAFKFEGWLLNIENQIDNDLLANLVYFVSKLTKLMKKEVSNSQVVWYDSVSFVTGECLHQNELNNLNLPFFSTTDGLFLNYCWTENKLKSSAQLVELLDRKYDLFIGIDIFGRGCFGGGGMSTNLAIEKIKDYDLSIALFAPGWVHEVLGPKDFDCNQIMFWNKLELDVRHVPKNLPFSSNFSQGFGEKYFTKGYISKDKPWLNFSLTQPQSRKYQLGEVYTQDAYEGGSSILLKSFSEPLLNCFFELPQEGLFVALIYKTLKSIPGFVLNIGVNICDRSEGQAKKIKIEELK